MLINSSYFVGDINIPNTGYSDVSSQIDTLVSIHEPMFMNYLLGYELYKAFKDSVLSGSPEQRFTDLLFGFDFTHNDSTHRWPGLISVSSDGPFVNIGVDKEFFITVGAVDGPVDGSDTYTNVYLNGKSFRVVQRGFGPLIPGTDYEALPGGGFKLLNTVTFENDDVYNIQITGVTIGIGDAIIAPVQISPIADYVYYYWQRNNNTNTSGIGEVKSAGANTSAASAIYKMTSAWNRMVNVITPLVRHMQRNVDTWPEFRRHNDVKGLRNILTPINSFNV